MSFSIPCESWGSATTLYSCGQADGCAFQYSLRIVGFRDRAQAAGTRREWQLSVFPANRGVPRLSAYAQAYHVHVLSVFPANRGVPRLYSRESGYSPYMAFSIPCESWGSATTSLSWDTLFTFFLSVFPANRGVPRPLGTLGILGTVEPFSIPCESWGSATVSHVWTITP